MNDREILNLSCKGSELVCFINEQKWLSALDILEEIKLDILEELKK